MIDELVGNGEVTGPGPSATEPIAEIADPAVLPDVDPAAQELSVKRLIANVGELRDLTQVLAGMYFGAIDPETAQKAQTTLNNAVLSGDLTREQADKIWKDLGEVEMQKQRNSEEI